MLALEKAFISLCRSSSVEIFISIAKLNNRCFCYFTAAMLRRAQTWRLHTKLNTFGWHTFAKSASRFPSRTCLHFTNSRSFAMDILLSFCLKCLSKAANVTLRLSGSKSEPSLLRISAKNRERRSSSSLASYLTIVKTLAFYPRLPNIHPRLRIFGCVFVNCFFDELFCFLTGNFQEPCRHFFENKSKNVDCVQCCHGNLIIPSIFMLLYCYYAEIVLLSTNQNSEISYKLIVIQ